MASLDAYISLVPSENYGQPNFAAWLSAKLQGDVDNQNLLASFPELFNPLTAVGQQLDFVGEWVGISRDLEVPLAGVYFSWGIPGLGWGEGTWFAPGDDPDSLIVLPDDTYRTLVLAKIAANHWDGTIPGAYQVWADVFGPGKILIQDNMDMTLTIIWLGAQDAVTLALLLGGLFTLRPAGVGVTGYFVSSVPNAPLFGWGIESATISGWGTGAWIEKL
jgi:hypothetical protein